MFGYKDRRNILKRSFNKMKTESVIQVVNDLGVPINVRFHVKDGQELITFYDSRFRQGRFKEFGQKISDYCVDTIAEHKNMLYLDLGVESWQVSHENIKRIQKELLT